ncbi:MAG TPA: hypothetical protein VFZ83_13165, partial [Acidimicrobiia bacterium]|nr:hypothetical protein [Acidimicrobiia bacterium]
EAFALLAVRSDFFRWYVDGGEDIEVAWCVASRIIDLSTLEQLNDPDGSFYASNEFFAVLDTAESACGAAPLE